MDNFKIAKRLNDFLETSEIIKVIEELASTLGKQLVYNMKVRFCPGFHSSQMSDIVKVESGNISGRGSLNGKPALFMYGPKALKVAELRKQSREEMKANKSSNTASASISNGKDITKLQSGSKRLTEFNKFVKDNKATDFSVAIKYSDKVSPVNGILYSEDGKVVTLFTARNPMKGDAPELGFEYNMMDAGDLMDATPYRDAIKRYYDGKVDAKTVLLLQGNNGPMPVTGFDFDEDMFYINA